MSEARAGAAAPEDLAALESLEAELDERWPETRIEPSLTRIAALMDLLGSPQRAYPTIHVAGTNGKSSVCRMADALLTRMHMRVGRTTSPHLQSVTERIAIDGEPISPAGYVRTYRDIEPYVQMVDDSSVAAGGPRMSKFEVLTAMAFAAFADAPVDVGVIETGLGGRWDATNVIDSQVAVITPIGLDHAEYLGTEITGIAGEKADIIKSTSVAVLSEQRPEVSEVLLRRAVEVDAAVAREGSEFAVLERRTAVGGQMLRIQGLGGVYDDVFVPLHGEHQAHNAALALAAVEAFFGAGKDRKLDDDAVREGFATLVNPGRLEPVRTAPSVFIDAAHNPHGARALAAALSGEFHFRRLVGVVAIMADKDVRGILEALEPVFDELVVTHNGSPRCMSPAQLSELAADVYGDDRVHVAQSLPAALESAVELAEEVSGPGEEISGSGVVITGSVVTAGLARTMLGKEPT
ncbi:bifunctional tetrahydrofolate synthase/dihydrofolate synthase [Tomitella gaofuii]|uniref:bifunctional tetrahydrofolate synthase/dihydrofolate synthase n=1 Tax=Tomitella gaofuii TaxID=2760083 RepID=UPI0015FD1EA2|nr:folylpolyglutamate synthase/dihydrofolate synthase family protein [Tomitella gaofuii]